MGKFNYFKVVGSWYVVKPAVISVENREKNCHGTLIGNHRWRIDQCRFRWLWVTPKRMEAVGQIIGHISLTTLVPSVPRTTKFARISRGSSIFLGVTYAPTSGGGVPVLPSFGGFPSIYAYTLSRRATLLSALDWNCITILCTALLFYVLAI